MGTGQAGGAATGGLLAVHAHPDDETLSTGALLATWAAAGRPVTVVTCTRGEQGEVIPAGLARLEGDGPALAAHRETELAAALEALGVFDHVFLDRVPLPDDAVHGPVRYVDSGMAWAGAGRATAAEHVPAGAFVTVDLDEAAARLATVLRDRRPDVVVGYEPGGGYGHPDHVRAHEVMHRALELAADPGALRVRGVSGGPWRVPVVLWSVLDAAAVRSARRELGLPDPDRPLPSAAVDRTSIDLEVDLGRVREQVVTAMRAHASQVRLLDVQDAPDRAVAGRTLGRYALSNGVPTPLMATECYRLAVAPGRAAPTPTPGVVWPPGVAPVAPETSGPTVT